LSTREQFLRSGGHADLSKVLVFEQIDPSLIGLLVTG
jgi:hypothetical protein